MKNPLSASEGLKKFQTFLDDADPDALQTDFNQLRDLLGDPCAPQGLKYRFLLHAMNSKHEWVREQARTQVMALFGSGEDREMLNELLGYAMEDYRDAGHARAILIRLMLAELKANRRFWPHETVKFVISLRRVFEISYSLSFARDCVACLFLLMADRERDPSTALSQLAFERIYSALRSGRAPDETIAGIKLELAGINLENVDALMIHAICDGLPGETNPNRVAGSLLLLTRWYQFFPIHAHPDPEAFFARIQLYYREQKDCLKVQDRRCLEANSKMVEIIEHLIETWPKSKVIGLKAVAVLCNLPTARKLIRDRNIENWPIFLRLWRDPLYPHFFDMALTFFRHFVVGIGVNLDRGETTLTSPGEKDSYRKTLVAVNRWANLAKDLDVLRLLSELIGDTTASLSNRKKAVDCLVAIHPPDLEARFMDFARSHGSLDPLISHLLVVIKNNPSWDFWPFCTHYLGSYEFGSPSLILLDLIRAGGSTEHSSMVEFMVSFVLDVPNSEISTSASKALSDSGYEVFLEREKIVRLLRRVQPAKDKLISSLEQIYQDSSTRMKEQAANKREITEVNHELEADGLVLRVQTTNFRSFATEKLIVLAEIDKQLEELTRKIAHLTTRKNELHLAMDELLRRRNILLNKLDATIKSVNQLSNEIEILKKKISKAENNLIKLENKRKSLVQDLNNQKQNFDAVHRKQNDDNDKRLSRHNGLTQEISSCRGEVKNLENSYNNLKNEQSNKESELRSLKSNISSLKQQIKAEPEGSSRRSSMSDDLNKLLSMSGRCDQDINDLRGRAQQANRQRDKLMDQVREMSDECKEITQAVNHSRELVAKEKNKLSVASRNQKENEQAISRLADEIHQLKGTLSNITRMKEELERDAKILEAEIQVLQKEELRLEALLIPVIRDLEEAKREFRRINQEREREESEIQIEKKRVEGLRHSLQKQIKVHEQQFDQVQDQIRELTAHISKLQTRHTDLSSQLQDIVQTIKDNKANFENLSRYCETAIVEKNQAAYTRTILARLERDQKQIHALEYARAIDSAARALVKEKEGQS